MKLTTSSIILSLSMLLLPTAFAGNQKKPVGKKLNHKEDNNVSPPSTTKLDFGITVYRSAEGALSAGDILKRVQTGYASRLGHDHMSSGLARSPQTKEQRDFVTQFVRDYQQLREKYRAP